VRRMMDLWSCSGSPVGKHVSIHGMLTVADLPAPMTWNAAAAECAPSEWAVKRLAVVAPACTQDEADIVSAQTHDDDLPSSTKQSLPLSVTNRHSVEDHGGGSESALRAQRHVRFNLDDIVVHEVVPYTEIYGLHPKDFVFDARYNLRPVLRKSWPRLRMAPASRSTPKDEDEEEVEGDSDSDEEDFRSRGPIVISLYDAVVSV